MSLLGLLIEEEEKPETVTGSEETKEIGPTKSETVKINVDTFAKHLREFVDTFENQLDIPSVIVNRARNIVKDKHPDAIESFDEALYDVGLSGKPRYADVEDDNFQPGATGGGGA